MDSGCQLTALMKGSKYKDGSVDVPEFSKNCCQPMCLSQQVIKTRDNWNTPTFPENSLDRLKPPAFRAPQVN